jgi:FkbM family methyltransferase
LFKTVEAGSLIVGLPDYFGSFEIDCHSDVLRMIMVKGEYEPELVKAVKSRVDPNRDAIDVGANVGLFTVLLSRLLAESGRVLAIEPTPGALHYLYKNLERNHSNTKVVVFEGVATQISGEFTINVVPGMEEYSSIVELVHPDAKGKPTNQLKVPGSTIDELVERFALHPGLMKIDTEGTELKVLMGARQTLAVHRPVIVCESWPDELILAAGGSPGAVAQLLRSHGYDVLDHGGEIIAVPVPTAAKSR